MMHRFVHGQTPEGVGEEANATVLETEPRRSVELENRWCRIAELPDRVDALEVQERDKI